MTSRKFAATLPISLCILLLLAQQGGRAQGPPPDALRFFNNFFVTGDYVVGGVGLWSNGHGSINMSSPAAPMSAAPAGAEPLAAFLYWEVVTSANPTTVNVNAGATFNGLPLNVPLGSQLLPTSQGVTVGTQACLLNGGTSKRVHTFRADVLRFLDMDLATGQRVINKVGGYPVALTNNGTTKTLGASMVVIYRDPNPATPLNAIVIYDGTFVKQQTATLNQTIKGFYDPANVGGRITYVAGSAQSNLGERLTGPFAPPTQSGLFRSAAGNAWDNISLATTALGEGTSSFSTAIAPQNTGLGSLLNDCIAMGAMVYRTEVIDGDKDGLLDKWESSSGLRDPNDVPLPNLALMGADPAVKDIFIEIGAMHAGPGTKYGSLSAPFNTTAVDCNDADADGDFIESIPNSPVVVDCVGHNHLPTPEALRMWGQEFADHNVNVHFDIGSPDAYRAQFSTVENPNAADAFLISATYATGGELIDETACSPEEGDDCQFPDYPGTVSWKSGFQLYKEQYFDANRKDSFRYALYAHAKAAPKSPIPCLAGAPGSSVLDASGNCVSGVNPAFHVPAGVSGSGEYPGGDFLITLGLWDNARFVGSDFGVASTSMHELGHTLNLGHGGLALPNCKPNYLSVMNYLFQLTGLMNADGVPNLGFSESPLLPIDETVLADGEAIGGYELPGLYRTSWYAPVSATDTRRAKRFCSGLKFDPALPQPSMMRVDGAVGSPIDWNANGTTTESGLTQDVNFDGAGPTTTLQGFDDWSNLRLNQVGSRRNFGGLSIGPLGVRFLSDGSRLLADGSRLLADGSRLLADGSRLLADGSRLLADGTRFLADGSVLLADGSRLLADGSQLLADGSRLLADGSRLLADGSVLLADGSVLLADGAKFGTNGVVLLADGVRLLSDGVSVDSGSRFLADGVTAAWEFSETTPIEAIESGTTPGPHSLRACVIGAGDCAAVGGLHRVFLNWKAPNTGNVYAYRIYRAEGPKVTPSGGTLIKILIGPQTFYEDLDELPNTLPGDRVFTYVVDAVLDGPTGSVTPTSNSRTITPINDAPVAFGQSVGINEDLSLSPPTSLAITLTAEDSDSPSLNYSIVTSPSHGTLSGTAPNVTYKPFLNYFGSDSFTFKANDKSLSCCNDPGRDSNVATVLITVNPVNDVPSFAKGLNWANLTVSQSAGPQQKAGWAAPLNAGPSNSTPPADPAATESDQALNFIVTNSHNALFTVQPAIAQDGTLTYTPAPTPPLSASVVVTVSVVIHDNGSTANGGVDTSDPQTFTITILPAANHAPQGTDKTITTKKNTKYYFTLADFGFTDPNDVPPNTFLSVKVSTLATPSTLGDLYLQQPNGTWTKCLAGTFVSKADIMASKFKYWPASNKTGQATFTFQVKDNGGTLNGGVDVDPTPNVMTIKVIN